jgi:glycosyltransferase involved in cell wall biosynthesis
VEPNPQIDLSLVVCTRNRADQLHSALESYAALAYDGAWELVVVDNGSTDDTPALLRSFGEDFGGRMRVLCETQPGLARARNTGWRASSGRLVVFTDDDCYPQADYLVQVASCFQESPLAFLGGRVLLFDPQDYPITIQLLNHRVDLPPRSYIRPGLIHGANFAFLRDVLVSIGGFDERLGAGTELYCAEDTDALARASANGYTGAYDPRPVVRHHHRRRDLDEIARIRRGHAIGAGAYHLKAVLNPRLSLRYSLRWLVAIYRARIKGALWHMQGAWRFVKASVLGEGG